MVRSPFTSSQFLILHIPHASKVIPKDVRSTLVISDEELIGEITCMTDAFTDELFDLEPALARKVIFPVSRLVVDPERFNDDVNEPMSEKGMGAVYTKTSTGRELRCHLSAKERTSLITRYYEPHHERLAKAVEIALVSYGWSLIIDCHSFPSFPLPYEPDQNQDRPNICIGTDTSHTPKWLADLAIDLFKEQGYRTSLNHPYSGTIVPRPFYLTNPAVLSIMLEVNRSLYMNEASGAPNEHFEEFKGSLKATLRSLLRRTVQYRSKSTKNQGQGNQSRRPPY